MRTKCPPVERPKDGLKGFEHLFRGRKRELTLLKGKVKKELVVGVNGEAHIGKSSIVDKLTFDLREEGHKVIDLKFSHTGSPRELPWCLATELYDLRPRWEKLEASIFGRPAVAVFIVTIITTVVSLLLIRPWVDMLSKLHPYMPFILAFLGPAISSSITYALRGRLGERARRIKPDYIGREEKHLEKAKRAGEPELTKYLLDTLSGVCGRLDKRLIVKIDDLRNVDDYDRQWLFNFIALIMRGDKLNACFLLAWRIPKDELPEMLRPYFYTLEKMRPDGIALIFEDVGVHVDEEVKGIVWERVRGLPGIANMVALSLLWKGVERLSRDNIDNDDVKRAFVEAYKEYLRAAGLEKRWKRLYELIAIMGEAPSPRWHDALDHMIRWLREECNVRIDDVVRGLEELKRKMILAERGEPGEMRYEIVPDVLRDTIYESIESHFKYTAHYQLASFYQELYEKAKPDMPISYLEAIARHAEKASRIQTNPDLERMELEARQELARIYFVAFPSVLFPSSSQLTRHARRGIELARRLGKHSVECALKCAIKVQRDFFVLSLLEEVGLIEAGFLEELKSYLRATHELKACVEKLRQVGYLRERNYHIAMAVTEYRLGKIYHSLGKLEEALKHFRAAREHGEAIGEEARLGVAISTMNEASCLLLMGGEERAEEALKLLLKARRTFDKLGPRACQYLSRSLGLACLAHLSLGQDDEALSAALRASEVALNYLADLPDVARSLLVVSYACLVARRVPEALKAVEKPGDIPEHVCVADQLSLNAMRGFEACEEFSSAYIAGLVHDIALCLAGCLDVKTLLDSFVVARDKFDRPLLARLLSECIEHLEARRCLDEEFLRRKFLKVLAV